MHLDNVIPALKVLNRGMAMQTTSKYHIGIVGTSITVYIYILCMYYIVVIVVLPDYCTCMLLDPVIPAFIQE